MVRIRQYTIEHTYKHTGILTGEHTRAIDHAHAYEHTYEHAYEHTYEHAYEHIYEYSCMYTVIVFVYLSVYRLLIFLYKANKMNVSDLRERIFEAISIHVLGESQHMLPRYEKQFRENAEEAIIERDEAKHRYAIYEPLDDVNMFLCYITDDNKIDFEF